AEQARDAEAGRGAAAHQGRGSAGDAPPRGPAPLPPRRREPCHPRRRISLAYGKGGVTTGSPTEGFFDRHATVESTSRVSCHVHRSWHGDVQPLLWCSYRGRDFVCVLASIVPCLPN